MIQRTLISTLTNEGKEGIIDFLLPSELQGRVYDNTLYVYCANRLLIGYTCTRDEVLVHLRPCMDSCENALRKMVTRHLFPVADLVYSIDLEE